MGRGKKSVYLDYTALVLLSATFSTSLAENTIITPTTTQLIDIWHVSIDESPAPPRRLEPPFSKNAIRNPAVLPYQIIGVVGAYIFSVLVIGSLLLTVGRSSRKRAQNHAAQSTELVKPLTKILDRSPASEPRPWYSPQRLKQKRSEASSMRSASSVRSPGMDSIASFDRSVIEADKMKRQMEMERLYAAVMASDDNRGGASPQQPQQQQQNVTALPPMTPDQPPEYSKNNLPNLVTDGRILRRMERGASSQDALNYSGPLTPRTPVRAIYPPDSNLPAGLASPTSPIRAGYPAWAERTSSQPQQPQVPHSREPSFTSSRGARSATSDASTSNKSRWGRKSVRGLKISAPIARIGGEDNSDGARTPLSPRFYADPGLPPEPPTAGTMRSAMYPPPTPATPMSPSGESEFDEIDEVRDLPSANPQRGQVAGYNYGNQAQMVTDAASMRPDPNSTRGGGGGRAAPAAVGNGTLPLRELNRQYAAQQQRQQQPSAFPLSPTTWNAGQQHIPASAGPVKTTFLDAPHRPGFGGAPLTGMPTPYSAYMPFTPVTPVTAGLTTRAERKQREKERRRERAPPTMEEDAVAEEGEMWGEEY